MALEVFKLWAGDARNLVVMPGYVESIITIIPRMTEPNDGEFGHD